MPTNSENKIKVVTVEGTIMGGPVVYGQAGSDGVVEMLKEAHEDEGTKAIVLRVNSPGGSVIDSDYMRWEIEKAQEKGIPVIVSMGTLAASGGYWISSLADKIMLNQTLLQAPYVFTVLYLALKKYMNGWA